MPNDKTNKTASYFNSQCSDSHVWGDFGGKLPRENLQSMKINEFTESNMSVGDLALVFEAMYERSSDQVGGKALKERVDNAKNWYKFFSKS